MTGVAVVAARMDAAKTLARRLGLPVSRAFSARNVTTSVRGCVLDVVLLDEGVELSREVAEALQCAMLGSPSGGEVFRLRRVSLPPPF
ncbi:hypothetical protein FGG30_gp088 [Mycobacterium phage Pixie]|uniref:Uncharacterized protein n=2 Tax=Keshuvirus pixie TaxID=1034114 RepID=G1D4Z7_9CAUD|nr:hypothetical protein FGG30_gp088 [Mycobacterium phage Pixie]AEK09898.1 hypothetical protein PBI_PIXIE_88 [Mycobacterium phage Pixie]AOT23824.1 hypothetical protein SEA_TBOND007_85 [Mycobacterium phage TBond007]